MEFFGRGADDWNMDNLASSEDISEAARLLGELETALESYSLIRERADTLEAERERRAQRSDMEDDIQRLLTEIDALAENVAAPDEQPTDATDDSEAAPEPNAASPQVEASAVITELRDKLRASEDAKRDAERGEQVAERDKRDADHQARRYARGKRTGYDRIQRSAEQSRGT